MKNFTDLTNKEKEMVLNWRNNIRVRENMYCNNEITLENHLKFIEKLSCDEKNKYFLIDDFGVIYFNNINNKEAEIGLYSNPTKYGVGDILMKKILEFDFKYLYLDVIETNKKAIELYLNYNFKIKESRINKNKSIIYMELKR